MTTGQPDRLDRIEAVLEQFITASEQDRRASDERMRQIDARLEQFITTSDERMTRVEQVVDSNNRFLESFSQDLRRYTDNMDRLTQQLAATTSNANQDRLETNTRLSAINRKVDAIATHLGVNP